MSDIIAYTDGGCRGNPGGIGGWAFVLVDRARRQALERSDAVAETTSNRMELQAVIEALAAVRRPSARILVLSDSKYVVNCGSKWIAGWKQRGWKRKTGELKNVDLLQQLHLRFAPHDVEWRWLPGHAGEPGNERVDLLVNEAMDSLIARREARSERRFEWKPRLP